MKLTVPDFSQSRVLVVGDIMLDRYWYGVTQRISPEAPVPVVWVKENDERAGGAGNVAVNISSLGAQVSLLGIVGKDEAAQSLEQILQKERVNTYLLPVAGVPTITKLRVISHHQQLIRMDFEDSFGNIDLTNLVDKFEELLLHHDVVVISDYAKGTLGLLQNMINLAKLAGKPVLIDPKNLDITVYRGATLITPNFNEFQGMVGTCNHDYELVEKGQLLIDQLGLESLLITRGEQGMTLLRPNHPELHLPSRAQDVFDVTGAGDTVIATTAAALATQLPIEQAVTLANCAAGIVVSKVGTATISAAELRHYVLSADMVKRGLIDEYELLSAVQIARAQGERIVMTNGCFDILHIGHVTYLKQARQLGDRLIVAVNDDLSVGTLKGPSRPLNRLEHRMAVLSSLECVDWVVPFAEETPEKLIRKIMPDILVKGGDYQPEQIAGAKYVLDAGGEVKVLNLVAGASTTQIVQKIKSSSEK